MEQELDYIERLEDFFSFRTEILLAYLFGSASRGRVHPLSDIDIAVLLDEDVFRELDRKAPWGYKASLIGELTAVLRRNDVDLVLLHQAPPLLVHEVVHSGRLLFKRDEDTRVDFEVGVHREYLDTRPLRAIQRFYLYEAIKEDRLGRTGTEA